MSTTIIQPRARHADVLAVLREHGEHESRDGGAVIVTIAAPAAGAPAAA